jgi:hypothetical protein
MPKPKYVRARETGDSPKRFTLSPALAGLRLFYYSILGLALQALCCRRLRRLIKLDYAVHLNNGA